MFQINLKTAVDLLLALALMSGSPVLAQAQENGQGTPDDSPGLEEVLEGFNDEAPKPPRLAEDLDEVLGGFEELPLSVFQLSGFLSLGVSYNFAHDAPEPGEADYRGLSRLRPKVNLVLDTKISPDWKAKVGGHGFYDLAYRVKGRDEFTEEVLDTHEDEVELDEAYIQGSLFSNLDIKLGRQIVVWGKADTIRVTDVLNPLDNREPGLVDIEDLRLPVTMTKLDYYFGKWNLGALPVHEIRFNKDPAFGSDFYPLASPLPPGEEPDEGFTESEFGLALKGMFTGWDISFFGAYFLDDQPHLERAGAAGMKRVHSRLTMVGTSVNLAQGNWLFKGEAAYFEGLEFFALPGETKPRLDVLTGVEYSGFTDTTIIFEVANRHLFEFDSRLKDNPDNAVEDDFQSAIRYNRTFMHDRLELTLLTSVFGLSGGNGDFERVSVKYDLTDQWSVTGGVVLYQSGDKAMFKNIERNDRLFFELKFCF